MPGDDRLLVRDDIRGCEVLRDRVAAVDGDCLETGRVVFVVADCSPALL